ncbi:MAG: deoxycytidine triphosphate deaminase [Methylomonas sp.]|nr:MAG: deoxycytidine triphosphate deaminase [Methylomonas sp.]
MTFWSSSTLKQHLPNLITPCDLERVAQSSYTLRVGKEIFVTKDRHNRNSQHTKRSLEENQAFVIPPGQFSFLLTEEKVKVPKNAIAFISMKAGFKYKGLINISGFHVDPGFEGNLLFSVYNAGPSPIHLKRNEECFLIWYANLDKIDTLPRTKEGFSEIPISVLNQISTDEVYSIHALTTKISEVEEKYKSVSWWILGIKTVGGLLFAAVISGVSLAYSHWDTISQHYVFLNRLVDEHKQQWEKQSSSTQANNNKNRVETKKSK